MTHSDVLKKLPGFHPFATCRGELEFVHAEEVRDVKPSGVDEFVIAIYRCRQCKSRLKWRHAMLDPEPGQCASLMAVHGVPVGKWCESGPGELVRDLARNLSSLDGERR